MRMRCERVKVKLSPQTTLRVEPFPHLSFFLTNFAENLLRVQNKVCVCGKKIRGQPKSKKKRFKELEYLIGVLL